MMRKETAEKLALVKAHFAGKAFSEATFNNYCAKADIRLSLNTVKKYCVLEYHDVYDEDALELEADDDDYIYEFNPYYERIYRIVE